MIHMQIMLFSDLSNSLAMFKQKSNAGAHDADIVQAMLDKLEENIDEFIVALIDDKKKIFDQWTIPQIEWKRNHYHATAVYLSNDDDEKHAYHIAKLAALDKILDELTLCVKHRTQVELLNSKSREMKKTRKSRDDIVYVKELYDYIIQNQRYLAESLQQDNSRLCQKVKFKLDNFHKESVNIVNKITKQLTNLLSTENQSEQSLHQNTFLRYTPNVFLDN